MNRFLTALLLAASAHAEDGTEFFDAKALPILQQRCYDCHSLHEPRHGDATQRQTRRQRDRRARTWHAGGGIKPGLTHGETDDFGFRPVSGKVHLHDLHATILHQLVSDHEKLTWRHLGRDYRLTDVYGEVVQEILA